MKVASPPFDSLAVREMYDLWEMAFGPDIAPDITFDPLSGAEKNANDFRVYRVFIADQLGATAIVVAPIALPELGALGEVATHPEFRNRGLASGLCEQLLEDFQCQGGEAMFLGTVNPNAARIYERFGWSHIPDTKLMVNLAGNETPNEFLKSYFTDLDTPEAQVGEATSRIPIIPLIVSPHSWSVLDANASIFSPRVESQASCLGLYNRYQTLRNESRGEWFTLVADSGKVLGISSAVHVEGKRFQVDGFCHESYAGMFGELIQTAISWCSDQGATQIIARLSSMDEEKQSLFESVGFHKQRLDGTFEHGNQKVDAVVYLLG